MFRVYILKGLLSSFVVTWVFGQLSAGKVSDKCSKDGVVLTGLSGNISSPMFPDVYPPRQTCRWIISAPQGHRVQLSFHTFQLETCLIPFVCTCDYVRIRDGNNEKSPSLGKFCGGNKPPFIQSSGRFLWVEFVTDRTRNEKGFNATYTNVDCFDDDKDCPKYEQKGYCYDPSKFDNSKSQCAKTCNLCDTTGPESPPVRVTPGAALGECGASVVTHGRVIGGEDSVHGSWPWQVGLYNGDDNNNFFCGGSLIKPDWVLTASHCISWFIKPSDYRIRLGDWHRFYVDGTEQVRNVSKIITHPNYHRPVLVNNDVALIKLDRPVVLNSHVNTVCLPKMGEQVSLNSTCFITGWGKVKHPGGPYHHLQQAKLPLVSDKECYDKLKLSPVGILLNLTQQMLCAGEPYGDVMRAGCHGDSGGPFVCKESSSGKFVLQGVVSWGSGNCNFEQENKQYTVFARISELRQWINDTIEMFSSQ